MVSAALGSAGACAVGNSERGRGHWGWAVGGGPLETGTGRREENLNAVKKLVFEDENKREQTSEKNSDKKVKDWLCSRMRKKQTKVDNF